MQRLFCGKIWESMRVLPPARCNSVWAAGLSSAASGVGGCRISPHAPGFVTLRRGKRAIRLMALSDRSDRSDRSDLADWHCVNRCNSAYRLLVPSIGVFYSPSNRQKFFSVGLSLYASLACIFASAKSFSRRASRQSLLLRSARRFLTSRG